MGAVKRLWSWLRHIPRRIYALTLGLIGVFILTTVVVVYAWDYTNSPSFCGTTCHTMPPEYKAYQVSPHARVACVECHIGRTFVGNAFTRKAGDLMHVVRYASNDYKFPLYATDMQPARESCEKCHWPQKFSDDKIVQRKHYGDDAANTLDATVLVLKTGGGTVREGRGIGIHWHIDNEVLFIGSDPLNQNIPWVQVTDANGKQTVYMDVEKPLTADEVAKLPKRRMDCIDCHNRISHTFRSPEQAVDQALALKQLDANIPSIRKESVALLNAKYTSFDEANKAIEGLDAYYRQQYGDYYQKNPKSVASAVTYLKQLYGELVFPTQDLSWTTHPDNLGHQNAPGCFRCHDGKHFTADSQQAIRLECNVCHTLPQTTKANQGVPVVPLAKGNEPESHQKTTWLAEHRTVFNATCQDCHDTRNAGGKDNSSFCSNGACHGVKWTYAGLNAPALAKIYPLPAMPKPQGKPAAQIPHPIGGAPDCQICHGAKSIVKPYPSNHVNVANQQCRTCHTASIEPPASERAPKPAPEIPHDTTSRAACLACHDSNISNMPKVPLYHKDFAFDNSSCTTCHKMKPGVTASSSGARALPASHAGRTLCNVCHVTGVGGAPKSPPDHADRADATCKDCHKQS